MRCNFVKQQFMDSDRAISHLVFDERILAFDVCIIPVIGPASTNNVCKTIGFKTYFRQVTLPGSRQKTPIIELRNKDLGIDANTVKTIKSSLTLFVWQQIRTIYETVDVRTLGATDSIVFIREFFEDSFAFETFECHAGEYFDTQRFLNDMQRCTASFMQTNAMALARAMLPTQASVHATQFVAAPMQMAYQPPLPIGPPPPLPRAHPRVAPLTSASSLVPFQKRKRQEDGSGVQGRRYTATTTRSYQQVGSTTAAMYSLPPIQAPDTVVDPSGGLPPFNLAHSTFRDPASKVYFEETTVHTKRAAVGGFAGALAGSPGVAATTTTTTASGGSKRLTLIEPPGEQEHGEQYDEGFAWGEEDADEELCEDGSGDEPENDGGILIDQDEAYRGDLAAASDYGYDHAAGGAICSLLNECGGLNPMQDRY
jgi:hypothetical protein